RPLRPHRRQGRPRLPRPDVRRHGLRSPRRHRAPPQPPPHPLPPPDGVAGERRPRAEANLTPSPLSVRQGETAVVLTFGGLGRSLTLFSPPLRPTEGRAPV